MEFKRKPWKHQYEAIEASRDATNYALFFEQGTGKTLTCVNILRIKFLRAKKFLRTFIFCPDIVMSNWKKEILENSNIRPDEIILLQGKAAYRAETIDNHRSESKIFICNYHCLQMTEVVQAMLAYRPEVLVFDESHRLKSLKAIRTKAAIRLADKTKHKVLLTGTPILNSLMDIFSQFRILDGGTTFGKNFISFRHRYFYDVNAGMPKGKYFPDWRPKPGSSSAISRKISAQSRVIRKKDCLDLPPLVKVPIEFKLPYRLSVAYEEMKNDFITYVEDEACVAQFAMTKALRLLQICTGFIKTDSGSIKSFNARRDVLTEILKERTPHSKVIVWAVFKENYKDIRKVCEEIGVKYVEVHGDVNAKDKDRAVEEFNTSSDVRVYIGHPGSGGIGVNLTASDCSVVYSRTWNLEFELQSEARNYRGGSEIHNKITRYDIVAKDTIDEKVMQALNNKEKMSLKVLKGIAKEMKNERNPPSL